MNCQHGPAQIDVDQVQFSGLTQPHSGAVQHERERTQHRPPHVATLVPRGSVHQGKHLFTAEDVGHKHRFLDRRHRVIGDEALRIAATTEQAQLAYHAELVAHRDGLAALDPRCPLRHRLVQRHRAFAVLVTDEAHEAVEHKLGAAVTYAHGPLECQELRCVARQGGGGNLFTHRGTGRETSRSDCVAMRT